MTPRESVIAVLVRHAEWCLDQADREVVRDLPAWQREHARGVVRLVTVLLGVLAAPEAVGLETRLAELEGRA